MSGEYTDSDRAYFLKVLDEAALNVTDWEAKFIESNLDSVQFTPKQREVISRLIEKYGDRAGF